MYIEIPAISSREMVASPKPHSGTSILRLDLEPQSLAVFQGEDGNFLRSELERLLEHPTVFHRFQGVGSRVLRFRLQVEDVES